jgi:hypothetical protein
MMRFQTILSVVLCSIGVTMLPAFSQGSNQAIFQDERQMELDNQARINGLSNQEQSAKQSAQAYDAKSEPYRLYAEKRIAQLIQLKAAGGSPSRSYANQTGGLHALENWLQSDTKTRANEQARIKQLNQAITNLRESENADQSNMSGAIQGMREGQIAAQSDDDFNKMMRINQFNELQSEMGAASWGRPPQDGTFNSTGGYGMGGGYGYSMGGGRRW